MATRRTCLWKRGVIVSEVFEIEIFRYNPENEQEPYFSYIEASKKRENNNK